MFAPILGILGAVALGLCALGFYLVVRIRKNTRGIPVTGEVSGFASYISHGRSMFCAQYRATVDGQVVTGNATVSKSWKSPPVGTKVSLRYRTDATADESKLTDTSWLPYIAPATLFVVAGVLGTMMFSGALATPRIGSSMHRSSMHEPAVAHWDGKAPFTCGSHDDVTLSGIDATLEGTAVSATGHCNLTLVDITLVAATGIDASDHATVTVRGGSITSSVAAVAASEHARVSLTATKVSGPLKKTRAAIITGP
jgi:hypothetical protein